MNSTREHDTSLFNYFNYEIYLVSETAAVDFEYAKLNSLSSEKDQVHCNLEGFKKGISFRFTGKNRYSDMRRLLKSRKKSMRFIKRCSVLGTTTDEKKIEQFTVIRLGEKKDPTSVDEE